MLCDDSLRLYERVALNVATEWNTNNNCLLVVGATYPVEAEQVRVMVGDVPFLIPGVGAQGGDVEAIVMAAHDSRKWGMVINASRSIILASDKADFAEAARRETEKLHNLIGQFL
jgi:orotidine-5'-phosphate decarboxylase